MRSGHLVFGVGLVLMGYALTVIALAEQAQRAATGTSTHAAAIEAPAAAQTPPPSAAPPPTAIPTSATASAATQPAGSAAAPTPEPSESADVRLFKFSPGGASMSRDEVARLMALGKSLGHRAAKVSIEGFGDLPGSEPLMVGIAKHRAKVAQTLLAKAGLPEDRVITSFVDMGTEAQLARCIRVTTTPPLSELEKP